MTEPTGLPFRDVKRAAESGIIIAPDVVCKLCVAGESVISGDFKEIAQMTGAEHVVGISGTTHSRRQLAHHYEGDMIRVKARGLLPIYLTPEHPVLVFEAKANNDAGVGGRLQSLCWKPASELRAKHEFSVGDYVVVPKLPTNDTSTSISLSGFTTKHGQTLSKTPKVFYINNTSAWLLGVYVAEGFRGASSVALSIGKHEVAFRDKICDAINRLGFKARVVTAATALVIHLESRVLRRAFDAWCGTGARHKHMPEFILYQSRREILLSFLNGLFEGDGYTVRKSGKTYRALATSSRTLAIQVQATLLSLGYVSSIFEGKRHASVIAGRRVVGGPQYQVHWSENQTHAAVRRFGMWSLSPVSEVLRVPFSGTVYNLETDDGTFTANNVLVHNCGEVSGTEGEYHQKCLNLKTIETFERAMASNEQVILSNNYVAGLLSKLDATMQKLATPSQVTVANVPAASLEVSVSGPSTPPKEEKPKNEGVLFPFPDANPKPTTPLGPASSKGDYMRRKKGLR